MSLLNITSGITFDTDSNQIYTGANTYLLYSTPTGTRALISDLVISAQEGGEGVYLLQLGETEATVRTVRRIFLGSGSSGSGLWIENRRLPLQGKENENIYFAVTSKSGASISVSGEVI